MKRIFAFLVCCIAFSGICGENLLKNPGFEEIGVKGRPAVWLPSQVRNYGVVSTPSGRVFRLKTRASNGQNRGGILQTVAAVPPGGYRISGRVRGNVRNVLAVVRHAPGVKPQLVCLSVSSSEMRTLSEGWSQFVLKGKIPAAHRGQAMVIFEVWSGSPDDEIFLDDLEFVSSGSAVPAVKKSAAVGASSGKMLTEKEVRVLGKLVAQPAASVEIAWPRPVVAGKEYWQMLEDTFWFGTDFMETEEFIREAGWQCRRNSFFTDNSPRYGSMRKLVIRELQVFRSGRNQAKEARITVSCPPDAEWLCREYLTDGNSRTSFVVSGDPIPKNLRYLPVRANIRLVFDRKEALERIVVEDDPVAPAEKILVTDQQEQPVEILQETRQGNQLILTCAPGQKVSAVNLSLTSRLFRHRIDLASHPKVAEMLDGKLFSIMPPYRSGTLFGKTPDNLDRPSFEKLYMRYGRNFLGFDIGEWDSNFLQFKNRASRSHMVSYSEFFSARRPQNRVEAEAVLRNVFAVHQDVCDGHFMPHAGALHSQQYACEYGATASNIQNSTEQILFDHRINTVFGRSAGRQYDVPWGTYLAYHVGSVIPGDNPGNRANIGVCWGASPGYTLRYFLYCYYMGALFQQYESQNGMMTRLPSGKLALTENGLALKKMYDWTRRPESARGDAYTPMLILLDYHHGYIDSYRRGRGIFYTLPFEDGDYMTDHHFRAFSDCGGCETSKAPYQRNMVNSELGEICDTYFANPPTGVVSPAELGRYAVTVLSGKISFSDELVKNLMQYVADGGTLVVNAAHVEAFRKHPEFLGLIPDGTWQQKAQMNCMGFKATTAQTVMTGPENLPLVTASSWGQGRVLVTLPRYMVNTINRTKPLPLIAKVLKTLAGEVEPLQVDGDIMHLYNRMPDGSWKVILINNKGMEKQAKSSVDILHPEYAAKVTLTVRKDSPELRARELYHNVPVTRNGRSFSLTVPPGDVCVVHIHGIDFVPPRRPGLIGSPSYVQRHGLVRRPSRPVFVPEADPCRLEYDKGTDLFAEYRMADQKENGRLHDSSGRGNHGQIHKGQFMGEGRGRFLRFSGLESYGDILMTHRRPFRNGAVEVWMRPRKTERNMKNVSFLSSASFFLQGAGGKWHLMMYSGAGNHIVKTLYEKPIDFDEWHHIVITWKGYSVRFYLDGKEIYSREGRCSVSGPFMPPASVGCAPHFYLATHYFGPGRHGIADMDLGYFRVLGRLMTAEEAASRSRQFHSR